jgi:hypothetical protein
LLHPFLPIHLKAYPTSREVMPTKEKVKHNVTTSQNNQPIGKTISMEENF